MGLNLKVRQMAGDEGPILPIAYAVIICDLIARAQKNVFPREFLCRSVFRITTTRVSEYYLSFRLAAIAIHSEGGDEIGEYIPMGSAMGLGGRDRVPGGGGEPCSKP